MAGMNVRDDVLNKIEKPKPSGRDLAYRAVAAVFGGPVDLTAMVMKPFGYDVEKPVLGSEWIGQKMQNAGLVSEARDPMLEFMASLLVPGGGIEAVPALASKGMAMLPAAMGVIKAKGGNWLTGSVEDVLRPLQRALGVEREGVETFSGMTDRAVENAKRTFAIDDWVAGPLTKYVKTRMASPDDELRKLADQGVLHFAPDEPGSFNSLLYGRRQELGQKPMGEATSDLGMSWEGLSDNAIGIHKGGNEYGDAFAISIDPRNLDKLGFRHLTDELSNALNPESGLPRALQLSPDQMKNLSVEKAVRRVADINKWRADNLAEANKVIANNAATLSHKEYQTVPGHGGGQPNEKGLKWMELKHQGDDKPFQDAVKYEGDTMGHSVGGYASEGTYGLGGLQAARDGKVQLYTLRDKAGKPHVTIEVGEPKSAQYWNKQDVPLAVWERFRNDARPYVLQKYLQENEPDLYLKLAEKKGVGKLSITQIKGAKNSAPKDEYVPFIQDFIRNGNFSDVGDLANAQMKRASQTFNKTELKTLEKHGAKLTGEEYLTNTEVEALQRLFKKAKDQ